MVKATVEKAGPRNSRTAEGISAQASFIVEASDLRDHNNIRKAPVVIESMTTRRNREGKEGRKQGGGKLSCVSMAAEQCGPFWIHSEPILER